jgi:hypothetical protein
MLTASMGVNYGYSISKESFETYNLDIKKVDAAIEKNPPKTESEKFVNEVYQKFKSGDKDIWGECKIVRTEEFNFNL